MKMMIRPLLPVVGAVFLSFCSGNPGNPLDAGTLDAGTLDAGTLDAGTLDAGTPDGGRIDVNGKVVNTSGGTSANVVVVIKSGAAFSVITSTDADGKFSVANVPTPYDAAVVFGSGGATVSVGLTSTTPTVLDMLSGSPFLPASASLSGAVTGGLGFPSPPGYRTSVLFTSPEVQTDQTVMADLTTGDYVAARDYKGDPGSLFWSGPTTSTGTLHALQWRQEHPYDDDPYDVHVPSSYSGYGFKENVSLINAVIS
jgi:hypothetical protein